MNQSNNNDINWSLYLSSGEVEIWEGRYVSTPGYICKLVDKAANTERIVHSAQILEEFGKLVHSIP